MRTKVSPNSVGVLVWLRETALCVCVLDEAFSEQHRDRQREVVLGLKSPLARHGETQSHEDSHT